MDANLPKASSYPDDRLDRIEDQLHKLDDAPRQLGTILNIVTGLEATLSELICPGKCALLQSSAVSRNPLWGRLKRHGSAPSIRPPMSELVTLTHSPASSRRESHRKGTESSICTPRGVKDTGVHSQPKANSPRLKKSRSFESLVIGQHCSDASGLAGAQNSPSKKGVRRDSRSTSAPTPRRPSFSNILTNLTKKPSNGNESLSRFVMRQQHEGSESPTLEKRRPSIHSELTGQSDNSSISYNGYNGNGTAYIRRPSGFSDLSPKVATFNLSIANHQALGRDLPRIDSEVSYFADEKWMRCSSFKLDAHKQIPFCMFLPYSWPRLTWDVFIMTMTACVSFVIPMGIVYFDADAGFLSDHALRAILFVADFFWLIDVVINFRTGVFCSGILILDPRTVAERYAKSWFPLDVVVLFPVVVSQGSTWCSILQILKLLRILKFVPGFSRLQKRLRNFVLMPVKLMLCVCIGAHLLACMWRAVQSADDANSKELEKWEALYVKDMYWVLMTMTTVGYGDIHPTGISTRIYAIAVMLLASVSFGAAITTVSHLTRTCFNDEVEDSIAKASKFMRRRHIPRNLQQRVVSNLRHNLHQSHLSPAELFSQISPSLQRELSLSFLSETVLKFPLFRAAHRSCVAELAQAHLWVECFPNDLVSEPGQIVEEVVFVVHGHLIAFCPRDATIDVNLGEALSFGIFTIDDDSEEHMQAFEPGGVDLELNAGAWFGEACLLNDEERIRVAPVMSVSQSELAILKQKEYQRIIGMFPQLLKQHQNVQQALRDGVLSLRDLAHKAKQPTLVSKPSFLNNFMRRTRSQIVPSETQFEGVSEHT